MKTPKTGRASIFRFKSNRVQGLLSAKGMQAFESARVTLAQLAGRKAKDVSDGDTIEYLARGPVETKRSIAQHEG